MLASPWPMSSWLGSTCCRALLAMALAGDADYLVTGDRRAGLLQRGHIERTRIVTPAVFCVEVL